jgi:hypothetical protein
MAPSSFFIFSFSSDKFTHPFSKPQQNVKVLKIYFSISLTKSDCEMLF